MKKKTSFYQAPTLRVTPLQAPKTLCTSGMKDLDDHTVYEEGDDF